MNEFDTRSVTIKGLPTFTCSKCGTRAVGSTVRLALNTLNNDVIMRAVTNVSMSHIPVGWASFADNDVRCPAHIIKPGLARSEQEWLVRFVNRLRSYNITETQVDFILQADGAEVHLDMMPEDAADAEIKQLEAVNMGRSGNPV